MYQGSVSRRGEALDWRPRWRLTGLIAALSILAVAGTAGATVVAGPFTNPANGHVYYMLDAKGWLASEAEAVALGGHLATIDDAAENTWVSGTFFPFASGQGNLWIGLNDAALEGTFVWVSGAPVVYLNWAPGEPNENGDENHTHIFGPGRVESPQWNDFNEAGIAGTLTVPHGVVEVVPGSVPTLAIGASAMIGLVLLGSGFAVVRARY